MEEASVQVAWKHPVQSSLFGAVVALPPLVVMVGVGGGVARLKTDWLLGTLRTSCVFLNQPTSAVSVI